MKKLYWLALCAILLITFTATTWAATGEDDGWKLVMDKKGTKAYVREVEGSPIKEIRAVTTVDATLENIGEVLRDTEGNTEWLPYCAQAEELKDYHRNKKDLYFMLDLPWPVSNRDLVIHSDTRYDLDAGRAIVDLTATTVDDKPATDEAVRIKDFSGVYVFEYIDRNKTGIIYTYRVDLAGNIPVFVMNFMGKYTLYDTFKNLRKMVKEQKYLDLAAASPDKEICESILNDQDKVRKVFRTRLNEFIGDKQFVDQVAADDDMLNAFFNEKTGLAEILLYGWGSADSKKEAITALLEIWLPKQMDDPKKANKLAQDPELVEAILSGNGKAMAIIENSAAKA